MKRRTPIEILFIHLITFVLISHGVSQETSLRGKVVNAESGLPLSGADVFLLVNRIGSVTGDNGIFSLPIPESALSDTLVIRFLGYREVRLAVREFQNGTTIKLIPQSIALPDSVLVRGQRIDVVRQEIPHARSTITARAIALRGAGDISDVFKSLSAVQIEGNDVTGRHIQIRGSDPAEVNVYVDGILINALSGDNQADLSILPVESVDNIEVLKGANLTLLGSGAFGGVVYVTTRRDVQRRVFLQTRLGSFHSRYVTGDVNIPLSRKLIFHYFGQYNGIEPEIEFFPGERFSDKTRNNRITTARQNHHISLDYYLPQGQLSARFYGYLLDYQKPFLEDTRRNLLFAGVYRGKLLTIPGIDLNVNYLSGDDKIVRRSDADVSFRSDFISRRLNVRLLKRFRFSGNEFQVLGEYLHDELESRSDKHQDELSFPLYRALLYENRLAFAGVAAFQNQFNGRAEISWKTHLGLRGDFVATGEKYLSPAMGFQLEIVKTPWTITPYLNYGKNVRIQTLQDNAYVSLLHITAQDTQLVRLKPEESNAYEAGVTAAFQGPESRFQSLDFSLAVFRTSLFNKLLRRPLEPLTVNSQTGRNITTGIEGSVRMNRWYGMLDIAANFLYLNISNPLLYAYKPESKVSLQLDLPNVAGFHFSTTLFFEGPGTAWFYDLDNNLATETIGSFYDVDVSLGVGFHVGKLKGDLQLSGLNIFDNSGYRFYLLKKRFWQGALGVRF